ncbi:ER protein Pkr1-domain-containing protein [Pyronema omphalodes]|nr:ER protein Pkr1-domain-containing protein [Pyronema omphalodes]
MSKFINDIWNSVFEPGTNKSVLIATYSSFAALQATLFGLLLATRSWHFVFLSVICGGLWGAVAWFVKELEAVKKMEAEADRLRELRKANGEDSASEEENRKKR